MGELKKGDAERSPQWRGRRWTREKKEGKTRGKFFGRIVFGKAVIVVVCLIWNRASCYSFYQEQKIASMRSAMLFSPMSSSSTATAASSRVSTIRLSSALPPRKRATSSAMQLSMRFGDGQLELGSSNRRTRQPAMRTPVLTQRGIASVASISSPAYSSFRSFSTNLHSALPGTDEDIAKPTTEIQFDVPNRPENSPASGNDSLIGTDQGVFHQLKSRPKPDGSGNWDPYNPLSWTVDLGRPSQSQRTQVEALARLQPGDQGYFHVSDISVPKVTIVRTREQARIVMDCLMNADRKLLHACDTEVMSIDLKSVGPVGNGYVTCASIYSGPQFDYGLGEGPGSVLWIDNLDDAFGTLQEFKPWFENDQILKVWHNYGFDRHVMWNEGIDCRGFGGDTMHMARLQDTSRDKIGGLGEGYSLEAVTNHLIKRKKKTMKEIFGVKRLRKDGTEGSMVDIPPVEIMQRDPKFRSRWIMYSAFDAEGTWLVREKLQNLLESMPWVKGRNLYDYYELHMRVFGEVLTDMERRGIRIDAKYLNDVEEQARKDRAHHVDAFRKWAASKIGPDGMAINPASASQLCTFLFGGALNSKTKQSTEPVRVFKVPREEIPEEALLGYKERDDANKDDLSEPKTDDFDKMKAAQLKELCREYGLKISGKKDELKERLRGYFVTMTQSSSIDDLDSMSVADLRDACTARGLSDSGDAETLRNRLRGDTTFTLELMSTVSSRDSDGYKNIAEALEAFAKRDGGKLEEILNSVREKETAEPKFVDVTITSIGMKPVKYTAGGAPSVTADVLRKLAGDPLADPPKYGTAYDFYGGGRDGHDACVALYSLTAIGSIDTMIANFITNLQNLVDDQGRVHCSLNLNTETGRLSARRPNLQNQPALEKDKYKIRKAFQSSEGNNLIVADYGQLELRLLASMTNCISMIEAFQAGGDFHSRTALGMFDYIKKKVDDGECLLEWDYSKGDPPKPMLKDEFASERRKAKTLNFSIAYGKTAHGLSEDWGVSKKEANEMLEAWYNSRPEVRDWQKMTKDYAREHGITRTLMGRYRQLPNAIGNNHWLVGRSERASINTPIQGGAADVAMMAMNKMNESPKLKRLGWILLLQIHDEVILEGPEETAEEAFAEVKKCMEEPWVFGLDKTAVPLLVDGSHVHKNWYDAK